MNKIALTTDILIPSFTLVMIMVCIVGATIGINTLMKGKVFNFLLNKKLLLITASIISAHLTFAFMMVDEYYRGWGEVFWLVYFIGFIFVGAKYLPDLVLHLKKIHLSNLEDAEEEELRDANLKKLSDNLGCAKCLATPETDTNFDSLPFKKIKTIYDKSDSAFFISECCHCKQPYLEEYMDIGSSGWWQDDPMWSYWMPLTAKEVAILYKDDISLDDIEKIMRTRNFLINEKRDESTFEWAEPLEN